MKAEQTRCRFQGREELEIPLDSSTHSLTHPPREPRGLLAAPVYHCAHGLLLIIALVLWLLDFLSLLRAETPYKGYLLAQFAVYLLLTADCIYKLCDRLFWASSLKYFLAITLLVILGLSIALVWLELFKMPQNVAALGFFKSRGLILLFFEVSLLIGYA